MKILVIDDDPDIRETLKVILESNGYEPVIAASGKEGVEAFEKFSPDLVLCDMMMEHVDAGEKAAMQIRNIDKTKPVYLMSSIGNATAQNVEIDKLGFNGVFQKPVNPDDLIDTIKKVLGE